jgi:hypothetical protein
VRVETGTGQRLLTADHILRLLPIGMRDRGVCPSLQS